MMPKKKLSSPKEIAKIALFFEGILLKKPKQFLCCAAFAKRNINIRQKFTDRFK